MPLTLILTRHAKSSWSDPALDDFDRPLSKRGEKSSTAIGNWLAGRGLVPDEVLVSGARRTVDTWSGIAAQLPYAAPMRSEPALYHANAQAMLAVLRGARAATVLLIGHNPGMADLAELLVSDPADHPRFGDYPTAATAVIRFDAETWGDITPHAGALLDFVVPRELL